MADKSKISWCDATWQVVAGCSPISPGCAICYSARLLATRHKHLPWAQGLAEMTPSGPHWTGKVLCREDQLDWPFRKQKPLRIFVGDRGDLFHDEVPDEFIENVCRVMHAVSGHTFLLLTKRPERMRRFFEWWAACGVDLESHIWLGTSIEDQPRADERVPELLATPAAHRFLSIEPMLGPITLDLSGIDWVIVGGESGPGARVCEREWIGSIVRQCAAAHVPCFVKQLGANQRYDFGTCHPFPRQRSGADPSEWPEALRVRQTPWGDAMTKRPTRAERIRDACPGYDPPPMTHAEHFADLALEAEGLLRGACRMRDLYRAERSRADEAERLAIAADDFWSDARLDCECTSRLWDMPADVLAGIAAMRARQEQRGKGGGQ